MSDISIRQILQDMASGKKPIKITLFHANWCGHCTNFMPTWETMKSDETSHKNIDFEEYEEEAIGKLSDNERSINGRDVRSFGYPTIKINVNDSEYIYEGRRTIDDIYGSILEEIKQMSGVDGTVTLTKSEKGINISTSEEDAGNYQSETAQKPKGWEAARGGNGSVHRSVTTPGSNKSIFSKRLNDKDFKAFIDAGTFSEVVRIK